MQEIKQLKRRRSEKEDTDHKDEKDQKKDQKKEEPSHDGDRSHRVPHSGPAESDTELTLMGPLSYFQAGTFLDPGDRALEKFEKP